jgi:hypothetical protein
MESLTQKAIDKKNCEGKSSSREGAEKTGIRSLDFQLSLAQNGDTIVWASPPGPKEDDYGNYGFIFVGKVDVKNSAEKKINMTAIRIENPSIPQFNKAMRLITGKQVDNKIPEEFLRNPKVLMEDLNEGYIDSVLGMSFNFRPKKEEKEKFMKIIQRINPLIKDFVNLVKSGVRDGKIEALNVLENYFLMLKNDYKNETENVIYQKSEGNLNITALMGSYGQKPPEVRGSCGSTGSKNSLTSSNFLTRGSSINGLNEDEEWFTCPKCSYKANGPVGNQCPGCGLTKEEYARETGVKCD